MDTPYTAQHIHTLESQNRQLQRAYEVLLAMAEGTAISTGSDFFDSLVQHLASTLHVSHAFITECTDKSNTRVRTLAYWNESAFGDPIEYEVEGTPCEWVIRNTGQNRGTRQHVFYPQGLQQRYPQERGIESYLGIPLYETSGRVIGHLAVMDEKPMEDEPLVMAVLRIFAMRAAAELERLQLEAERTLTQEMRRRNQVAESLREIMIVLNSDQSLEDVLDYIVQQAQHILGADEGEVCRYQNGAYLALHLETRLRFAETLLKVTAAMQTASVHAKPTPIEDLASGMNIPMPDTFRAVLVVPLILKEQIYGCLMLYYSAPRTFSKGDLDLAMTFSTHFVLAIENANLRKKAEQMAAMEERNRIARELHDAVSQTLWSANLIADVLPEIWEQNADRGRFKLDQFRQLTRAALIEMRSLLLELRPTAMIETHIREHLQRLTDTITARSGLQIVLTIEGECPLPPEVLTTTYRITQEALNNVVRHASAQHVEVLLQCMPDCFDLSIMDDGRGFDITLRRAGHHGIRIMQERSLSIGATLRIVSQVGQGTVVHLAWMRP